MGNVRRQTFYFLLRLMTSLKIWFAARTDLVDGGPDKISTGVQPTMDVHCAQRVTIVNF